MNRQVFRKKALEQLSSPDQLDQLMQVTTTRGWLALLAVGIILVTAVLWGIFGTVPTRVASEGIILLKQGVFSITAESEGKVRSIEVREGQDIVKGQAIATIYSQEMEEKIEELTSKLSILRKNYEDDLEEYKETFKSSQDVVKSQRVTLEQEVRSQKSRLTRLRQKLVSQEALSLDQLITRQTLDATSQEILDTENEIKQLGDEIKKLDLQGIENKANFDEKVRKGESDIRQLADELDREKKDMLSQTELTSSLSGKVLKIEVKNGTIVNSGDRIALLEADRDAKTLEEEIYDAVVYASAAEGKRIKPGMEVQVIPATVKAEEYGVMIGKVVSVSGFPVSQYAMLNVLENPELVQAFLKSGAPIEVWVDLLSNPGNPSGYRWSSPKGPPERIYPGTLCAGNVVVQRQAPISLVIPLLREAVFGKEGMRGE